MQDVPMPSEELLHIHETDILVTVIQKYSNMYYHFVDEILPRIALARDYLIMNPNAKLLLWDSPIIRSYVEALGISSAQIIPFDPEVRYAV